MVVNLLSINFFRTETDVNADSVCVTHGEYCHWYWGSQAMTVGQRLYDQLGEM